MAGRSEWIGHRKATPELLEEAFEKAALDKIFCRGALHTWVEYDQIGGGMAAGCEFVRKSNLEGRKYKLINVNGYIGIYFLDARYDPRTFKVIRIDDVQQHQPR